MSIIFFIMFLVIISIIIYLVYDFINYKENVDKTIVNTTNFINQNFETVTSNLTTTKNKLQNNISKTNKDLISFRDKSKLNDNILNNKINNLDSDLIIFKDNTISDNNILNNRIDDLDSGVINFKNKTISDNNILNNRIDDVNTNLDNFDNSLKKYFRFTGNNEQELRNKKLYDHIFESITPDLKLIAKVEAVNGMTIRTSDDLNNKPFKICNSENNCLQLNVNNDGFNITPNNLNNLTINNTNNSPLAKFDMKNNSIYFGGEDLNAPIFINNSNLYLNNINMIYKAPGTVYDKSYDLNKLQTLRLTGEDMYEYGNMMSNTFDQISSAVGNEIIRYSGYYNNTIDFIDDNQSIFKSAIDKTTNTLGKIYDMSKQFTIYYTLKNIYIPNIGSTSNTQQPGTISEPINELYIKILPNQNLYSGDSIEFEISFYEIGNLVLVDTNNTKKYNIQNIAEQYIDIQNSIIELKQSSALFKIKLLSDIEKDKLFHFIIIGTMSNNIDQNIKYGITTGFLKIQNENIELQQANNKLKDFWNNQEWARSEQNNQQQ